LAAGFGELLRQPRLAAGLTQESLAERALLRIHPWERMAFSAHPFVHKGRRRRRLGSDQHTMLKADR
jgi:transcriptional regulator with XRE-family HTH domain